MKKIILILFLFEVFQAHSQQKVTQQAMYWIRYQNQLKLSSKFYWINEAENRRFFSPDVQNLIIAHSHVHYKRGPWNFGGGLTMSWSYAQIPENGYQYAAFEIRPFAEASNEQKLGKIFLQNRLRIDNRFLQVSKDQGVWEDSYYMMRLRYMLQARVVVRRKDDIPTISLKFGDEIMLNTKQNLFDQNRIYIATDFVVSRKITLEPSYVYVYQQRLGKDVFFSRHAIRFSVIHKI